MSHQKSEDQVMVGGTVLQTFRQWNSAIVCGVLGVLLLVVLGWYVYETHGNMGSYVMNNKLKFGLGLVGVVVVAALVIMNGVIAGTAHHA